MDIKRTFFDEVKIFKPEVYFDHRGFFTESFNNIIEEELNEGFIQDNHSKSYKNVLRGLHYQWDKPLPNLHISIGGLNTGWSPIDWSHLHQRHFGEHTAFPVARKLLQVGSKPNYLVAQHAQKQE